MCDREETDLHIMASGGKIPRNSNMPWEPTTFIFRGYNYNPYIWGPKTFIFHGFGVQRCLEGKKDSTDTDFLHDFANVRPKDTIV